MERISGPVPGYKVEAYTARTERGYLGVARVLRRDAGPAGADLVVDRLGVGPLPSEQQALHAAEGKAHHALLGRLLSTLA